MLTRDPGPPGSQATRTSTTTDSDFCTRVENRSRIARPRLVPSSKVRLNSPKRRDSRKRSPVAVLRRSQGRGSQYRDFLFRTAAIFSTPTGTDAELVSSSCASVWSLRDFHLDELQFRQAFTPLAEASGLSWQATLGKAKDPSCTSALSLSALRGRPALSPPGPRAEFQHRTRQQDRGI